MLSKGTPMHLPRLIAPQDAGPLMKYERLRPHLLVCFTTESGGQFEGLRPRACGRESLWLKQIK